MRARLLAVPMVLGLLACETTPRPEVAPAEAAPPSAAALPAQPGDTAAGLQVELVGSDPCVLRYGAAAPDRELPLRVSPPCSFHRGPAGAIRTLGVEDARVFLIERSIPDPAHPGDCRTSIQAVVVSRDTVRGSDAVADVATCAPAVWDEKMFIGLAQEGAR